MIRQPLPVLFLLLSCLLAVPAFAELNLEVVEADGQAEVQVFVSGEYADQYSGWVVTRQVIGTCDGPQAATGLLPFPAVMDGENDFGYADTTLVCSLPHEDILYLFDARLLDDQGQWVEFENEFHMPPLSTSDYLRYGDGIVFRGQLSWLPAGSDYLRILIDPCTDGCWGEDGSRLLMEIRLDSGDPVIAQAFAGDLVDVYGVPLEDTGLPSNSYAIDRIELAPGGVCAPVPSKAPTLDSFKGMFR